VVRVDSDTIYFRNWDGSVWAGPKTGGAPHKLSTGNGIFTTAPYGSVELDTNAKVAYWNWVDVDSAVPQGLFRSDAAGTAWTAIETSGDTYWGGPRVDDKYIFYFHAGALYRRLK
jgi:hypothetical protein